MKMTMRGLFYGSLDQKMTYPLVLSTLLVLTYVSLVAESAPQYDQSFVKTNFSRHVPQKQTTGRGRNEYMGDTSASHQGSHRERHSRDTQVETTKGPVRGLRRTVLGGKEVYAYLGIPFAKPPVGDLRFQKPEPMDPWNGTLYATNLPNSCVQERYDFFPGFPGEEMWNPNTPISEDCLYLNLWVPRSAVKHASSRNHKKLPVLLWIYGGTSLTIQFAAYECTVFHVDWGWVF